MAQGHKITDSPSFPEPVLFESGRQSRLTHVLTWRSFDGLLNNLFPTQVLVSDLVGNRVLGAGRDRCRDRAPV